MDDKKKLNRLAASAFAHCDRNLNGMVTREEFPAAIKDHCKPSIGADLTEPELLEMFDNIDVDSLGYLTAEEFLLLIPQLLQKMIDTHVSQTKRRKAEKKAKSGSARSGQPVGKKRVQVKTTSAKSAAAGDATGRSGPAPASGVVSTMYKSYASAGAGVRSPRKRLGRSPRSPRSPRTSIRSPRRSGR